MEKCLIIRRFWCLVGGLFFLLSQTSEAGAEPKPIIPGVPGFGVEAGGSLAIDGVRLEVTHFNWEWSLVTQKSLRVETGFPRRNPVSGDWETRGGLRVKDAAAPLMIEQQVEPLDGGAARLLYRATHSEGVATRDLSVRVELPISEFADRVITLDGQDHVLPVDFDRQVLFSAKQGRHVLELPVENGRLIIEGEFAVLAQDDRKWAGGSTFSVRLQFAAEAPRLETAWLDMEVRHQPYQSQPVVLDGVVNARLEAVLAGGESGEGIDRPSALFSASGVEFSRPDLTAASGNDVLLLAASDSISIPVPQQTSWRNIYLLHAGSGTSMAGQGAGRLIARYADGTETRHDVVAGRDRGDWQMPARTTNAIIGWLLENDGQSVGLYVSRFQLELKPLTEIRMENTDLSSWLIAGVSGSADDIPLRASKTPLTITAGRNWSPFVYSLEIEPGGIFDFSHHADAPAGKHGPLITTPSGHFEFAERPGVRARFWGVNLCFDANFLEPEQADLLADRLVRSGYNTVRLHHFDGALVKPGGRSYELDETLLDKLDYLFAALKQRGLYINIDLYASRGFRADEMAEFGLKARDTKGINYVYKGMLPVSEAAHLSWERFAHNFLTRRNPYTGLTWAEDPALIGICPVNEDSPYARVNYGELLPLYTQAFEDWRTLPENKDSVPAGETDAQRAVAFNQFIFEASIRADTRMIDYLRSLGSKALITGSNHRIAQGLTFVRERYDFVDNHQYWDHPRFPSNSWQLPQLHHQYSAVAGRPLIETGTEPARTVADTGAAWTPRGIMPTRVLGRPFAVTEFRFVRPNRYRAEGGVIMPAYASLQDWDAMYKFQYATSRQDALNVTTGSRFSITADPVGLVADRLSALLFLRGDIAPGNGMISYAVQPAEAFAVRDQLFPDSFTHLGLVTRIGSNTGEPEDVLAATKALAVVTGMPSATGKTYVAGETLASDLIQDGVLPPGSIDRVRGRFVSDTGQIQMDVGAGTLKVVTPRSEQFVLPAGQESKGDYVSVKNGVVFSTVSVVAVDGRDIAQSDRLLVVHLTDVLLTGMKFEHQDRRVMLASGAAPHLARRGTVDLVLRLPGDGNYQAWAVDLTGRRLREIPLTRTDAGWSLSASTVTDAEVHFAYEIVRR